jgi:hypothetical protein
MQQFTVPQFIDVEDKIIGPITARQFIIMLSGFMVIALCYRFFDFSLFIGSGLSIFAISGVFAFFKINGMPFHFFVLNFIETKKKPKIRVWLNRSLRIDVFKTDDTENQEKEYVPAPKKHISTSRLSELALIVDTRGAYRGEDENPESEEIKENVKTISLKY